MLNFIKKYYISSQVWAKSSVEISTKYFDQQLEINVTDAFKFVSYIEHSFSRLETMNTKSNTQLICIVLLAILHLNTSADSYDSYSGMYIFLNNYHSFPLLLSFH